MTEQEKRPIDSIVGFGFCQLDVRNVRLWRDSQEVKLTGKAFAVLCYFIDHPGQLVTKDDLFAAAWTETVVSDATLASCIHEVRQASGFVYLLQKRYDDAIAEFERTVALDENFVCGQMLLAYGLSHVGRVEEGVQVGERALRLKALPPDDRCLFGVADAYVLAGRLEEVAALHQRMLKQFPDFLWLHLELAALYSQLGRETEAQTAAAEVLRINPQFSLEVHKQRVPLKDPAALERHIAALRKTGLK